MSKYIPFLLSAILFFNKISTAQNAPVTVKEYKTLPHLPLTQIWTRYSNNEQLMQLK
jgi:hypothetical protein